MRDFLQPIISGKIRVGLVNTKEELIQVQKLKFKALLQEFNHSIHLPGEMLVDEMDEHCDHMIAIDSETNQVVATYRFVMKKHLKENEKFMSEDEFDFTLLKQEKIAELSRACIAPEYRNSLVLKLMWKGIYQYCKEMDAQYLFGTVSLHGNDITPYKQALTYLYYHQLSGNTFQIQAINSCDKLNQLDEENLDISLAKKEMNALMKGYIAVGCSVGDGIFIDKWFNSIDVFILLDTYHLNSFVKKLLK